MFRKSLHEILEHARAQLLRPILRALMIAGHDDKRIDAVVHVRCQSVEIANTTVVRQIYLLGFAGHDAINRLVRLIRIELNGRRCGNDELAFCGIEFPVRHAKTIS